MATAMHCDAWQWTKSADGNRQQSMAMDNSGWQWTAMHGDRRHRYTMTCHTMGHHAMPCQCNDMACHSMSGPGMAWHAMDSNGQQWREWATAERNAHLQRRKHHHHNIPK